jgi:hypothetical protein
MKPSIANVASELIEVAQEGHAKLLSHKEVFFNPSAKALSMTDFLCTIGASQRGTETLSGLTACRALSALANSPPAQTAQR